MHKNFSVVSTGKSREFPQENQEIFHKKIMKNFLVEIERVSTKKSREFPQENKEGFHRKIKRVSTGKL